MTTNQTIILINKRIKEIELEISKYENKKLNFDDKCYLTNLQLNLDTNKTLLKRIRDSLPTLEE